MNELKDLIRYLKQPSWSLEEAAHLVHGKIPGTSPSDMSPVSSETTSATYLWLKGQFEQTHSSLLAFDDLPSVRESLAANRRRGTRREWKEARQEYLRVLGREIAARTQFAVTTPAPFRERLTRF